MINRIKRTTLSEAVMEQLSELITKGQFEPGMKLPPERELANQFGVARGPIREALRALALVGLVDIKPGQGIFVRDPNVPLRNNSIIGVVLAEIEDIRDVYDARRVIESYMIERAATRISDAQLSELESLLDSMATVQTDEPTNHEKFAQLHYQFDLIVAEAAGNHILLDVFVGIRRIEMETHLKILRLPDAMLNSVIQHRHILAAIAARDVQLAREAAHSHFQSVERILQLLVDESEDEA